MDVQLFNSCWKGRIPPSNGFGRICQLSLLSNYALGRIELWKPVQLLFSPKFTKSNHEKSLSVIHSEAFFLLYDEMKNLYFRIHSNGLKHSNSPTSLKSFTTRNLYLGVILRSMQHSNCIRHIILQIEQFLHNRTWVEYSRSIRLQIK
jgi:hypothetical protein